MFATKLLIRRARGPDGDGASFWRNVYAHGHRGGRQPAGDFSGDRVPAFANGTLVDAVSQASRARQCREDFLRRSRPRWS